jgi:hypothetical protein
MPEKAAIARNSSDVAIFDMLVADFSIEDCHATLAMTVSDYFPANFGSILTAAPGILTL